MAFAKQMRNPFIQQYLIEIVFPLVGYFFFDWDILIIGVYYLVDHLCSQILFYRRAHWVNIKNSSPSGVHVLLISILVFLVFFVAESLGFNYIVLKTQGMDQSAVLQGVYAFAKSELWLLFPVVLLMYYLKDQFTFYARRFYLKCAFKQMIYWDLLSNFIMLFLFFIGAMIWIKLQFSDVWAIFIFLGVKIGFDLTLKRIVQKKILVK